jgi:UDP-N-acetyl-D-glucosamine dehydrogenase
MSASTSAPSHAATLEQKLKTRTAHVGVIGLGYVGLPLIVEFARAGFKGTGIDLDARKVASINRGESYIPDVPTSDVADFHKKGLLSATADAAAIRDFDTINICVPTPLRKTKDPDLSYVVSAVEMIAKHMRPGQLIVLESTTYPGTTDEVVRPILERGGLVTGKDFFLAFSPERVDPGNEKFTTRNVPKVVGGTTPDCSRLAGLLYSASIERVVEVSSPRVAEMVKLLENTFRAVNIGLVNELAMMCDRLGISVWEVVDAAATKPFGFMPFYPGPGLGGHCIPIDPFYLSWKVKEVGFEARFIELAGQVNGAMPHHVVDKITPTSATSTTSANPPRSTSWPCSARRARTSATTIPTRPIWPRATGRPAWTCTRSPSRPTPSPPPTASSSSPTTRCSTTPPSSTTRDSSSTPGTRSRVPGPTCTSSGLRTPQDELAKELFAFVPDCLDRCCELMIVVEEPERDVRP